MIKSILDKLLGSWNRDSSQTEFLEEARQLQELINAPIELETPKVETPVFYALIDKASGDICGITPSLSTDASIECVTLDYSLAEQFLTGKENVIMWIAVSSESGTTLMKREELSSQKFQRIESMTMQEITDPTVPCADIRVEIGARADAVLIHFNGETIHKWPRPVKLYFTAESNPHYLKCGFTLDVNIINEIQRVNELPEWPNPIVLPLPNAQDVSVYTIKSNIKTAVTRHEAIYN